MIYLTKSLAQLLYLYLLFFFKDKPDLSQYKWKRNDVADELSSMSGTDEQQQTLSRPAEVKVQQSQPTERAARHSSPVPSTSGSALSSKVDKGRY